MQFRALGPLEVLVEGQALDLGPRRQRSLLALLLIHADEVVPAEKIIEDLWGDEGANRENALWVSVSRLRTALEPKRVGRGASAVLLREGGGYRLEVDREQYDVAVFQRLAADGRALLDSDPTAASHVLTEALGLWRGSAFDEFRYDGFAQTEITRLADGRVTALEDRIDADLRRGLAGELVTELEVLRQEHPLRERPVEQLMLALYRSGALPTPCERSAGTGMRSAKSWASIRRRQSDDWRSRSSSTTSACNVPRAMAPCRSSHGRSIRSRVCARS